MTFAAAYPLLLKLAAKPQMASLLLGCEGKPHAVPAQAREVAELDWSACPLCLLRSPFVAMVEALEAAASVSPVAGWPDRFAAWAVCGVVHLRNARGR